MTRRKQGSSREHAFNSAAETAGPQHTPLDVLLRMMRDPGISSRDRIGIAKICLPFVHPRMAQLRPSDNEPEDEPIDICEPDYVLQLVRMLAFSLSSSAHEGREVPSHIWDLIRHIPRRPEDLKTPASSRGPQR
jgi:hypothetical protein